MKRIYTIVCIILAILGLYGVHVQTMEQALPMPTYIPPTWGVKEKTEPRVVNQLTSHGVYKEVTYDGESNRIMGVWQNSVETLLALGVGDRIIAALGIPSEKYIAPPYRTQYMAIPYKNMEMTDVETTLLWEPDLLVGWYSTFQKRNWRSTDFWEERNIHTFISPSSYPKGTRTLDGEYQYILDLGRIVNREERALELVNHMKSYVEEAKAYGLSQQQEEKALIVERMGKQLRVYDGSTLAGNMLEAIGGKQVDNVGETINIEELIHINPDVIFLVLVENDYERMDTLIQSLYDNPVLQHVSAIKQRRVHGLPLYMVYSAGTRVQDGLEVMIQGLYPNWTGGIHE